MRCSRGGSLVRRQPRPRSRPRADRPDRRASAAGASEARERRSAGGAPPRPISSAAPPSRRTIWRPCARRFDSGVLRVDPGLRITEASPRSHELLGRSAGSLVGRSLMEAFLDPGVETIARSAIERGSSAGDLRVADVDGPAIVVRARGVPSGGAWLVLDDVSELRRLQRIRTEFIDNLSHELRTPITTVSLLAETLQRDVEASGDAIPARMRERIGKIEVETGHLVQMVTELLDLSRIESGGTLDLVDGLDLGGLADIVGRAPADVRRAPGRHAADRCRPRPAADPRRCRTTRPGRRQPRPQRREVQPGWRRRRRSAYERMATRSSRRSRITASGSRGPPGSASSSGSTRWIGLGCAGRSGAARVLGWRSPDTSSPSTVAGSGSSRARGPDRPSPSRCPATGPHHHHTD